MLNRCDFIETGRYPFEFHCFSPVRITSNVVGAVGAGASAGGGGGGGSAGGIAAAAAAAAAAAITTTTFWF